jgi:hypothetical protein
MKLGISISIDVTKIEKARIHEGKKGKYIDLTTFIDTDQPDQYDNHGFISQSTTKEEREQNVRTAILGNCKVFYQEGGQPQYAHQSAQPVPAPPPNQPQGVQQRAPQAHNDFDDDTDLPF